MSIADVKAKVDAQISASHVLTLLYQKPDLGSAVDSVIHTYFADTLTGTVHLVNGQTGVIDEQKQEVTYRLSLSVQNFSLYKNTSPVKAQIIFSLKNNVIQCTVTIALPAAYALADSFGDLKNQPTLAINQIKLKDSVITIASDTKPAVGFAASLLPVGPLKPVEWLLGKDPMALTGSIDFIVKESKQFPSIDVTTASRHFDFGGLFALDLSVRIRSIVRSFPKSKPDYLLLVPIELVTEFKTKDLTLPVVVPLLGEGQHLMSIYLDLAKPVPPIKGLKDLSGFTADGDPKQFLNPELDLGKAKLSLDSLSAVLDPYAKQLVSLEIGASLDLDWTIIPNTLELEKIGAVFAIDDPVHPKLKNVSALLFAELKVGSVFLETSVLLPDKVLQAQLAPGSKIDVKEVIATFAPGLKLPANDDLAITQLEVSADLQKGQEAFSLEAEAHGTLTIIDGLTLDSILFFMAYEAQAISEVRLGCTLGLTNIQAELSLLADYQHDGGWQFEGSTGPGQAIPIGELINDMAPMFGAVNVPLAIEKLSIKDLKASFNTKSKDFDFGIEADFGSDAEIMLTFSNLHQDGASPPTFEKRATGVIKVLPGKPNEFELDLGIDLKSEGKYFVALYNNTAAQTLNLSDLVTAMAPDAHSLPPLPDFGITIKDAIVGYASTKVNGNTVSQLVVALDMGATIDLSSLGNIPLIGQTLSAAKTLKLAFQLVYPAVANDHKFSTADLAVLNSLITVPGPRFPADQPLSALSVKTELRLGGGNPIDLDLPVTVNPTSGELGNSGGSFNPPPGAQTTDDGVQWLQLDQAFGPVHLQRAGFKYENGRITVLLDGGLTALGLEVDLMELSVSSAITGLKDGEFKPQFGLQGLGLSFSKGGVGFAGALLHLTVKRNGKPVDEYDGLASVQAEGFRLAAIGSLTRVDDRTSLFLYAVLDYPLGGAPFFYVTGLAAGFGLNQKLIMPAVDQVSAFPLVAAAQNPPTVPTDAGAAGPFIKTQIENLEKYLTRSTGQYFGCAGVRFTSFELLDSFVLVSISFGREFELDLLGLSKLVVPPQEPSVPALAVASLQIVASFIPKEGLAIVQGQLTTDSYVLDPSCHLTGGFAFASWFGSNPNAGDFVITLGGYHPDFKKPGHYPTVPRIGINWTISQYLSVTGGLYFALTPRAMMAGGAMRAIFQMAFDLVEVKAWFILGADFISYWKPFHYQARLYAEIAIDVVIHFLGTHDIGFDVGADLEVWGPPFDGHAHISIKVIGIAVGFDVDFGTPASAPDPLGWDDQDASKSFRKSFLPADDKKIVSVAIGKGLVRKVEVNNKGNKEVWHVINPKDFCVRTTSVIPIKSCATTIQWADKKSGLGDFGSNFDFGIAPMDKDKDKIQTFHQITVKTPDGQSAESQFVLRPILGSAPGGLWAEQNSADINAERLIANAVLGFEIVPKDPPGPGPTKPIDRDALLYTTYAMSDAFPDHATKAFVAQQNPGWDYIQREIHNNATRGTMLPAMGFVENDLDIGETLVTNAAYPPSYGSLSH
jgi:hypothetical protein